MNCYCYNLFNELQRQINNLLTTAAHNRLTSGSSTTDDGAYRPNLNLLEPSVNNTFDLNTLFYAMIVLFTFFSFASMMNPRRRRMANRSTLN